jgi:hypothetical protein
MTKAAQVQYWHLHEPADMTTVITDVIEFDYRGTSGAYKDGNGLAVWELNLQGPQPSNQHITAHLGDVLVWDGSEINKMRVEIFQRQHDVDDHAVPE